VSCSIPDIDPAGVGAEVVRTVWNRLAQFIILEVVHSHGQRLALGMPLPPGILKVPHQFLLLGVHGDHGLSALLKPLGAPCDVLELRVAIGMLSPLARLAIGLKAVAQVLQHLADRLMAHSMALARQLGSQRAHALAGPAQRRHRVASR